MSDPVVPTEVRIAESAEDFRRFRDLVVEYERSLPADLKHSEFDREVDALPETYGDPNAAFVAWVDANAAGCVALKMLDGSAAVIKKLYVAPAHRNLGLARRLLTALVAHARSRGVARLVLDTERDRLPAAYRLYLSLGFQRCEPYGEVDYPSPTFMQMRLS